jgi:hypothetical protein
MKPQPAPSVPGNTPGERMSNALRTVLSVSKVELLERESRLKRTNRKRRTAKKSES